MQPIHEYTNAIYCVVLFNSLQHPSFKLKPPLRENQSNNAAWQYSYKTNNTDNAGSTDKYKKNARGNIGRPLPPPLHL